MQPLGAIDCMLTEKRMNISSLVTVQQSITGNIFACKILP